VTLTGTDVDGGCLIHADSEGEVLLRKHVFGIESLITSCKNEFWGRVNEDAQGYIFEQQLTTAGVGHQQCTRQACEEEVESHPWPATGTELGVGNEVLTTNFCVESLTHGSPESCEIDVTFKNKADHTSEFGNSTGTELPGHGVSGFRCELVGHWNTEASGAKLHDGEAPTNVIVAHV
jgi:hypothetical protein